MSSELNQNGTLTINAYGIADFLVEFEQAVINGFTLDLNSNDNYPQVFGGFFNVILVPTATEIIQESESEVSEAVIAKVVEQVSEQPSTVMKSEYFQESTLEDLDAGYPSVVIETPKLDNILDNGLASTADPEVVLDAVKSEPVVLTNRQRKKLEAAAKEQANKE